MSTINTSLAKDCDNEKIIIIGARMNHTLDENLISCDIDLSAPATIKVECKPQVNPPNYLWPESLYIWAKDSRGHIDGRVTFDAGNNCNPLPPTENSFPISPIDKTKDYFYLQITFTESKSNQPLEEDPTTITIGDEPPNQVNNKKHTK